jgi:hypothetical protein
MVAKPDRISEKLADSIGRRLAVVGQPVRIRLVDALSAEVELSVQELSHAVDAQLEQRVDRTHGTSFDQLVRKARQQLAATTSESEPHVLLAA